MGKQQLSTIDVAAEVACLRKRILGMNLINVFDISPKTYVLKLGTSGETGEKVFVLIESGCRLHTTQYDRPHSSFPSNFNLKLRKHIRNRKLNDVRQLGVDRIVDFTFGHEDKAVHLILEIYAQGNIVLTDYKYEVLTLLRTHSDADSKYVLMPKRPYPVQHIRMSESYTEATVLDVFFKNPQPRPMKSLLTELLPFGAACAEHVLLSAGIDPAERFPAEERDLDVDPEPLREAFRSENRFQDLMQEIKELEKWFHECSAQLPPGFILTREAPEAAQSAGRGPVEVYSEFEPFLLHQHQEKPHVCFETFDAALDEFFSKREGQKMAIAEASAQAAAESRLLKTKEDLEMRAQKLHEEAANEQLQGQLIEYNLAAVDEVLLAINSVIASGMSWDEVRSLIQNEKDQGNPVAQCVHSLQLEQNSVTLLLEDTISEAEGTPSRVKVIADLSLGAAANARVHYERRKKHSLKEQKTHEANETALKAAEKKVQAQLKKTKPAAGMHQLRKMHWFEKFYWFITTENYLVISGKDAQQNELLVKRYMTKDDIYVHADLHGATTTVVKNYKPGRMIPPVSLHQAGVACVCRSKAWEGKVITSAWWVYPQQVSKTAPTGEYLTTGSFMIRGKKNYLPPASLTYGFGFLFKVEESCMDRHKGERACKSEETLMREDVSAEGKSEMLSSEGGFEEAPGKSALDVFLEGSADHLSSQLDQRLEFSASEPPATDVPADDDHGRAPSARGKKGRKKGKQAWIEAFPAEESTQLRPTENEKEERPRSLGRARGGKKKGKKGFKDEEDLQLMAELLQSAGPKKTRSQKREARKQKKAEKRAAAFPDQDTKATEQEIKEVIAKAIETPFAASAELDEESLSEEALSEASLGEALMEGSTEEEAQPIYSHEAESRQLDSLTGTPHAEDIILFALPCCAPYDALAPFKYKLKLLPGSLKKGKAGKQALDLLTHVRDVAQRDLQLMKDVPEAEITNVMLGSVKLSMPGMQKIKQTQKAKKSKTSGK